MEIILLKLHNMNKLNDNKELTFNIFINGYKCWCYGNGYGLSKEVTNCFSIYNNLNEEQKQEILYKFLNS